MTIYGADMGPVTPSPTVGGVFTIRDAITVEYPFVESIVSALPLVDEMVIVDGGSTDGTLRVLQALADVYDTITLIEREEQAPTADHAVIDEQLLFGIEHLDTDWVFEVQADEIWFPRTLPAMAYVVSVADAVGAGSVRQGRAILDVDSGWWLATVRFVRNVDDLGSWSGGDSFYRRGNDSRAPYLDYTKHNVQPEYQTTVPFYHFITDRDDTAHTARHAEWLAQDNETRVERWEENKPDDAEMVADILNIDAEKMERDAIENYHPGTSDDVQETLFGDPVYHATGATKATLNDDIQRVTVSPPVSGTVTDADGITYDHGFHQSIDPDDETWDVRSDLDVRNANNPDTDHLSGVTPTGPYGRIGLPAITKETDVDAAIENLIYFHPQALQGETGIPYLEHVSD